MANHMISARPLETRYDTSRDGQLTVSTPSCCCCCCCCLGTVAGVLTFSARQVSNEADTNDGNPLGAVLSFFSFPLGIGAMIGAAFAFGDSGDSAPWLIIGIGALVAIAIYAIGHLLANKHNTAKAFAVPTLLAVVAGVSVVAEVLAVLFTVGIGWLVIIPLLAWGSYKLADSVSPRIKDDPYYRAPLPGLGVGTGIGAPNTPGAPIQPHPTHPPPSDSGLPPSGSLPGVATPSPPPDLPTGPPAIPDDRLPPDFPRT